MRQQKADIFSALEQDYQQLRDSRWQGKPYYAAWFKEPLNNARLALYNTYEGSHCAFQALWDESAGDWQKFHHLAEQKSRLAKDERQEWLKQSCPDSCTAGPVCDNLRLNRISVLEKFMTRRSESLATMRALTLFNIRHRFVTRINSRTSILLSAMSVVLMSIQGAVHAAEKVSRNLPARARAWRPW